jgi:hypothetical protein
MFGADAGPADIYAIAKEGTACRTAANAATCNAAVAAFRSTVGWRPASLGNERPSHRYLVYTRGDEVAAVTALEALATFLSPIENVKDAALLVNQRGHGFDCTRKNARKTATGWELVTRTGHTCGAGTHLDENRVAVTSTGEVTVLETVIIEQGNPNCAIGRRPEGFTPIAPIAAHDACLGATFASIAELEAASVHAFERLASELARHGAPGSLVEEARRAAWDEVRHAHAMKGLAERFAHDVTAPRVDAASARTLVDLALENAVEGCVRETFGALQATHQAKHAHDVAIARVMRTISEDETRHAALSWDVAAWIEPLLTTAERARVREARDRAVEALARDLATEPSDEAVALAGAPRAAESLRMLSAVRGELWAA